MPRKCSGACGIKYDILQHCKFLFKTLHMLHAWHECTSTFKFVACFSDLRMARGNLLDILANPNNEIPTLMTALNNYLSLLHGFKMSLDSNKPGDSKLRHAVKFRWTNTLLGNTPM